jgi:hypothetical protein
MSRRHDSQSEVRGRHTARVEGWSWELATDQRLIAELRRHMVRNAAHVVSAAGCAPIDDRSITCE